MELATEFTARVRSDILLGVRCSTAEEKAWMRGTGSALFLINRKGEVIETVQTKTETHPNDVAVTEDDEILFTNIQNKCIMRVTSERTITPFINTGNMIPTALCCSRNGDVLVTLIGDNVSSANSEQKSLAKVARFNKGGDAVQEIKQCPEGTPLYKTPEHICLNTSNCDICVSDWGSKTVIVVNEYGNFRFRFTGPPKSSTKYPDFFPRDITCDSEGRILIVDSGNECIQMLSADGDFLTYLLTDDDGLEDPFTLSIDFSGMLWVGEKFSKKVKLFKGKEKIEETEND